MTDHVERNQEWATLLRAELRTVWDGYTPNLTLATPNHDQGDEPVYDPIELEARRAAVRAARGVARSYGPGAAEGTRSTETA